MKIEFKNTGLIVPFSIWLEEAGLEEESKYLIEDYNSLRRSNYHKEFNGKPGDKEEIFIWYFSRYNSDKIFDSYNELLEQYGSKK